MGQTKIVTVEIEVYEQPDHTEAKALLPIDDDIRGGWGGHAAIPPTLTARDSTTS